MKIDTIRCSVGKFRPLYLMFGGNDPVLFSGRRGEGVRSIECRLVVAEFIVDYVC